MRSRDELAAALAVDEGADRADRADSVGGADRVGGGDKTDRADRAAKAGSAGALVMPAVSPVPVPVQVASRAPSS